MKTLIITAALVLASLASFGQTVKLPTAITTVVKTFPCHDTGSNIFNNKLKTIDSLKQKGFICIGFRVDNTFAKKGYNTQVLTFIKRVK